MNPHSNWMCKGRQAALPRGFPLLYRDNGSLTVSRDGEVYLPITDLDFFALPLRLKVGDRAPEMK